MFGIVDSLFFLDGCFIPAILMYDPMILTLYLNRLPLQSLNQFLICPFVHFWSIYFTGICILPLDFYMIDSLGHCHPPTQISPRVLSAAIRCFLVQCKHIKHILYGHQEVINLWQKMCKINNVSLNDSNNSGYSVYSVALTMVMRLKINYRHNVSRQLWIYWYMVMWQNLTI